MINYTDNPILIDVTRKRNKIQKIFCVLCNNEKIQLECINPEENRYKCPRCKNDYQLGFGEIIPQEDILESSHEENDDNGPVLLTAEDELRRIFGVRFRFNTNTCLYERYRYYDCNLQRRLGKKQTLPTEFHGK